MFRKLRFLVTLAALLASLGCTPPSPDVPPSGEASRETGIGTAARALHSLFDEEWSTRLARDPLFASEMGVADYNDRLPDVTPENYRRSLDEDLAFLQRLESIDRSALSADDQLNYDLFDFIIRSRTRLEHYRPYLIPILSDAGFHIDIQRMYESMSFKSVDDYENYLSRLRGVGRYFDQNIANMREGLRTASTSESREGSRSDLSRRTRSSSESIAV